MSLNDPKSPFLSDFLEPQGAQAPARFRLSFLPIFYYRHMKNFTVSYFSTNRTPVPLVHKHIALKFKTHSNRTLLNQMCSFKSVTIDLNYNFCRSHVVNSWVHAEQGSHSFTYSRVICDFVSLWHEPYFKYTTIFP